MFDSTCVRAHTMCRCLFVIFVVLQSCFCKGFCDSFTPPNLLSAIVVVSVADYGAFEHIFQMFLQVTWIFMWVCW